MLFIAHIAVLLHRTADQRIQLAAGLIIWRNNQRSLRIAGVLTRDFLGGSAGNFMSFIPFPSGVVDLLSCWT